MKQKLLFMTALLLMVASAWSATITIDGICYSTSGTTVSVVANSTNPYSGDVVIPDTIEYEGVKYVVTSIGNNAFYSCRGLTSITIPSSVTRIGNYAFYSCRGLTSITIPSSVTSIENYAFDGCSLLTSVTLPDSVVSVGEGAFYGCSSLTSITIPSSVISIGADVFYGCSSLTSITIPSSVTSIGADAFYGCSGLTSITIPSSVTSIGTSAFTNCASLVMVEMISNIPPTISASFFDYAIAVPDEALDTYRTASVWSDFASRIVPKSQTEKIITVTAQEATSGIYSEIGEDTLAYVVKLKVSGTINGYDIMVFKNKMINLRVLDLRDVTIVANDYEYYTNCHTKGHEIGTSFFDGCSRFVSIIIPNGVTRIGGYAFRDCSGLTLITIPNSVVSIETSAFEFCSHIKSIIIPPSVTEIGIFAFRNCYGLSSITIPSSVKSIGNYAFQACTLAKVYTYTVEPTYINQNTFSSATYSGATLYVPRTSYYNYYWNTEWSQFVNIDEFEDKYDNFYINDDLTLNDEEDTDNGHSGRIGGEPDATFNDESGFIVEGDSVQDIDVGDVYDDYWNRNGASVIGDGCQNIHMKRMRVHVKTAKNKWHFFCFPYDIPFSKIRFKGDYVFREYRGDIRAEQGSGGWQNLEATDTLLHAGHGYIFYGSLDDTLHLAIDEPCFHHDDYHHPLKHHGAEHDHDASWNFTGNPYPCYYDMDHMYKAGFTAPITIWDGSKYVTYRPGDDEYHFMPYEGFFLQKPDDRDNMDFGGTGCETHNQRDKKHEGAPARRQARALAAAESGRKLVNLTISDGENSDNTRIVFNDKAKASYEIGVDASKWLSSNVLQLYSVTLEDKYAINERPVGTGVVQLGFLAPTTGEYTIACPRMDAEVFLRDNVTGTEWDFSNGAYSFEAEKGTDETRFVIISTQSLSNLATTFEDIDVKVVANNDGILVQGAEGKTVRLFSTAGQLIQENVGGGQLNVAAGTYLVKIDNVVEKVCVK